MVFHMLHTLVGKETFSASLRDFVAGYGFRRASWVDIQRCFEQASGKDLSWFFDQWVSEPGAPDLAIENMSMKWNGTAYETRFDLVQRGRAYRPYCPGDVLFIGRSGTSHRRDRQRQEKLRNILGKPPGEDGARRRLRPLQSALVR